MAVFIAFIVILFAPHIGVEPGFIDDAASRLILDPKWVPAVATVLGLAAEAAILLRIHRGALEKVREAVRSTAAAYGGVAVVAVIARLVLGSSLFSHVIVAHGGHLTPAAWLILGGTLAALLIGGTLLGALALGIGGRGEKGFLRALGRIAGENAFSLAAGVAALILVGWLR